MIQIHLKYTFLQALSQIKNPFLTNKRVVKNSNIQHEMGLTFYFTL